MTPTAAGPLPPVASVAPVASAQVELLSPPTSIEPSRFHPSVGLPEQRVAYRPCPPWPDRHTSSSSSEAASPESALLTVTIPPASVPLIFAHRQWRAGLILGDLIAAASGAAAELFDMRGQSVLELGCGTGVPGMVAANLGGASRVRCDRAVLECERTSAYACSLAPTRRRSLRTMPLRRSSRRSRRTSDPTFLRRKSRRSYAPRASRGGQALGISRT